MFIVLRNLHIKDMGKLSPRDKDPEDEVVVCCFVCTQYILSNFCIIFEFHHWIKYVHNNSNEYNKTIGDEFGWPLSSPLDLGREMWSHTFLYICMSKCNKTR